MNHTQALATLDAAIAKASELGVAMTIAVLDGRSDLVALVRMEGAPRFTVEMARGKALVSAIFQQPSGDVDADSAMSRKLDQLHQGQMVFGQGAVPIHADGVLIAAVGASGAASEIDEQVALAAAAALGAR